MNTERLPLIAGGLLLAVVTSGCVVPAPHVPPPPTTIAVPPALPQPDPVRETLDAYARYRTLPRAELAREIDRLAQAGAADEATTPRLRLALALMAQHGPGDLARAAAQLDTWRASSSAVPPDAGLVALADLLAAQVAELRRLEDRQAELGQQLRDAQTRADQLGAKIDALKAIERRLISRPGADTAP